jgi:hypothetical protein
MKVGSLVRNKSSHTMGIVFRVWRNDASIHWIKSGNFTICSKHYNNLEVVCE